MGRVATTCRWPTARISVRPRLSALPFALRTVVAGVTIVRHAGTCEGERLTLGGLCRWFM